ncbi:hypothetical protein ABID81_001237 [Frigoribacterium sp. PvP054]|uniref:hypothetical protein n=1 Tax=Frigoribacterium sp. PvP054 TaxID=3156438 RepID=UPI003393E9A3
MTLRTSHASASAVWGAQAHCREFLITVTAHGIRWNWTAATYIDQRTNMTVTCETCTMFEQRPDHNAPAVARARS